MSETVTRKVVANEADLNRDPISGTPGAHPVGTGRARPQAALPARWRDWQ